MNYHAYITSLGWRERSHRFIDKAGHRCQRCGASGPGVVLQTHHKHYQTLGYEMRSDVEVLCVRCHGVVHGMRMR